MLSSAPLRTSDLRSRNAPQNLTICVVDSNVGDYRGWGDRGVRVEVVASGEAALRFARANPVDLWVVNTALPGLSGYELCSMLKARWNHTPVYLVADEYSPAAERAAWQSRATLFGCKGAHAAWLDHFVNSKVNSQVNSTPTTLS